MPNKFITILITGAGAGVGQSILKAAKLSSLNLRIITADGASLAAGLYRGHIAYLVPFYHDREYIPSLLKICQKEKVKLLFPGTDVELGLLAKNKDLIFQKTGTRVIVSKDKAVEIADDKWKTAEFLKKNGFPYAQSALSKDALKLAGKIGFPLIVKPRHGARSIGTTVVRSNIDLKRVIKTTEKPLIQEYLSDENQEYTCGAFFWNGQCYGVIPAQRWLRNGDTYKAVFKHDPELEKFIGQVGLALGVEGPCNFQLRKTDRGPVIFEINCRFSGTTGAAAGLGFNPIKEIVRHLCLGQSLKKLNFREAHMLRYWNETFVDSKNIASLAKTGRLANFKSKTNVF